MDARAANVAAVYAAADVAYANKLQRSATRLDFAPNPEVLRTAHRIYEPLRFEPGVSPATEHQLLAIHHRVAESALRKFAETHAEVLEIGPSLSSAAYFCRTVPAYHGCTLKSTRDGARHIRGMQSNNIRRQPQEFVNAAACLAAGIPSELFCVDGVGACAFESRIGIANHSLYDVTMSELADAFHLHGLQVLKAFLHMPEELLYLDECVNAEQGYRFRIEYPDLRVKDCTFDRWQRGGTRRTVHFGGHADASDFYVHDYETWVAYILVRHINTPYGFALHIEPQRRTGSQIEVVISRTRPGDRVVACVPRTFKNLCRVPNVVRLLFPSLEHEPHHIITVEDKVNSIFNFLATRTENEVRDLQCVMSFARARLRAIIVANDVREDSWNISPRDLYRVVLSVSIQHAIERKRMYVAQAAAYKALNPSKCFWSRFLLECWEAVVAWFCGPDIPGILREDTELLSAKCSALEPIVRDFQLSPESVLLLPRTLEMPRTAFDPDVLRHTTQKKKFGGGNGEVPDEFWRQVSADVQPFLDSLLLTSDGPLRALMEDVVELFSGERIGTEPVEVRFVTGPPGCGKTSRTLTAETRSKLFITPTQHLRADVAMRLERGSRAATTHAGLLEAARAHRSGRAYQVIVVDECFTYPAVFIRLLAHLSPSSTFICLGDPAQIGFIDFSGTMPDARNMMDLQRFCRTETLTRTHRCPHDICALPLVRAYYPDITSCSKRSESIVKVEPGYENKDCTVIVFTQEQKARLSREGAITAHEAQGSTFSRVILHYAGTPAEQKLLGRHQHLIVGLTRHTESLYIRDPTGEIETMINNDDRVESIMGPAPQEVYHVEPSTMTSPTGDSYVGPAQGDPRTANDVLVEVFGGHTLDELVAAPRADYEIHGAPGRINLECIEDDPPPRPYRRFGYGKFVKVTNSRDSHQALQTLMGRYTQRASRVRPEEARQDAARMMDYVSKYIDWTVSGDAYDRAYHDAVERFDARGGKLGDLHDNCAADVLGIEFLIKTQQKVTQQPVTSGKLGQGIAAHTKTANLRLAVRVRMLEEVLRSNHGAVRYSNGLPDEEEARYLEAKIAAISDVEFLAADWTQFDTAHNEVSVELFAMALAKVGADSEEIKLFRARCGPRDLTARGIGKVKVNGLLDSGAVWTLARNTFFNMAVMLTIVSGVKFAAFKGDDSLIAGKDLKLHPKRLHCGDFWLKKHLKPERARLVAYIGFIVSPEHVVQDPVRTGMKVFGRCYTTEAKYVEYCTAVQDLTKTWGDPRDFSVMCEVAARYYNMGRGAVEYVADTIRRVGRGEYSYETLQLVVPHGIPPKPDVARIPRSRRQNPDEYLSWRKRGGSDDGANIAYNWRDRSVSSVSARSEPPADVVWVDRARRTSTTSDNSLGGVRTQMRLAALLDDRKWVDGGTCAEEEARPLYAYTLPAEILRWGVIAARTSSESSTLGTHSMSRRLSFSHSPPTVSCGRSRTREVRRARSETSIENLSYDEAVAAVKASIVYSSQTEEEIVHHFARTVQLPACDQAATSVRLPFGDVPAELVDFLLQRKMQRKLGGTSDSRCRGSFGSGDATSAVRRGRPNRRLRPQRVVVDLSLIHI